MADDHSEIPEHLQGSALSLEASFQSIFHESPLLSPHARIAFETLEELGKGGMGTVYAVRDRRLDREAALKLLSHSTGDYVARTRFLREAKITAKLDHPSIPPVYETGLTPDGQLYMLMKRIRGKTLKDCIVDCHEDGILGIDDLIAVLVRVSEAIAYAHQNGIVHRDLKPENIMVGEFGEVLVIDWGIAKDLHSLEVSSNKDLFRDSCPVSAEDLAGAGMTVSGTLIGTPGYMSPEQIEGELVDTRVDVFALGANLVEILTGEKAVSGNSALEKIAATISGSVNLPIDLDPGISRELNWIASSALQIEKYSQTERAEDFVSQLKAHLAGRPIPGYP
ncbi:MAG: serine/threonine-protein kinase, partial [Planctomycetota bacterium]|nr:serine/threonine-protein kinase [Planctomycetota bacterium]